METNDVIRCESCRSVECGPFGPIEYRGASLCPQCYGRTVIAAVEIAEIEARRGKQLFEVEIVCGVEVWATDAKAARSIARDRFRGSEDPEDMIVAIRATLCPTTDIEDDLDLDDPFVGLDVEDESDSTSITGRVHRLMSTIVANIGRATSSEDDDPDGRRSRNLADEVLGDL